MEIKPLVSAIFFTYTCILWAWYFSGKFPKQFISLMRDEWMSHIHFSRTISTFFSPKKKEVEIEENLVEAGIFRSFPERKTNETFFLGIVKIVKVKVKRERKKTSHSNVFPFLYERKTIHVWDVRCDLNTMNNGLPNKQSSPLSSCNRNECNRKPRNNGEGIVCLNLMHEWVLNGPRRQDTLLTPISVVDLWNFWNSLSRFIQFD